MAYRNPSLSLRAPPKSTIPREVYSGLSLNILHKLWDARLCAGMEDEDVKYALKKVHGRIPDGDHELLCRGAWHFQANNMRIISSQWEDFFRFAFKKDPTRDDNYIFDQLARNWGSESNGKKTGREIADAWKYMFFAIGESLKLQPQEMSYHLCSCRISQPHSVTAPQKSLQFLYDSEENEAEEWVERAVSASTALIVLDFIIEEGGEKSKHTRKSSHKAVRSAVEGFKVARGLSDEKQEDLSNIITYLNKKLDRDLILDMPTEALVVIFRMLQYGDPQKALKDQQSLIHTHRVLANKLGTESRFQRRILAVKTATTLWDAILPHKPSVSHQQLIRLIEILGLVGSKRRKRVIDAVLGQVEDKQGKTIHALAQRLEYLDETQRKRIFEASLDMSGNNHTLAVGGLLLGLENLDQDQRKHLVSTVLTMQDGNPKADLIYMLGRKLAYLDNMQCKDFVDAAFKVAHVHVYANMGISQGLERLHQEQLLNHEKMKSLVDASFQLQELREQAQALAYLARRLKYFDTEQHKRIVDGVLQMEVGARAVGGLGGGLGRLDQKQHNRIVENILGPSLMINAEALAEAIRGVGRGFEYLNPQQRKLIINAMLQIKSETLRVYAIQGVLRWIKYVDQSQEVDGESCRRLVDAAVLGIKGSNGLTIVLTELGKVLDYLGQEQRNRIFEAILELGNAEALAALRTRCLNEVQNTQFADAVLRLEDKVKRAWVLSVL